MYLKRIYLVIVIFILFCHCSSKESYDGLAICQDFYTLNKNLDLTYFKNKEILSIREYSIYNENNQRNDRIPLVIALYPKGGSILALPTYANGADQEEKKVFFNRCDSITLEYLCNKYHNKMENSNLYDFYQVEVDSFHREYSKILVPKPLPYNNIPVRGFDGYIKFTLLDNREDKARYVCYLIIDSLKLEDSIKDRLMKLPKFDQMWYYEIKE